MVQFLPPLGKNPERNPDDDDVLYPQNLSSVEMPNRVHTGLDDIDLVGAFRQWNGNYNMSGWGSEFAAMINGTGGFMFHPRVSREERLTAFIDELYR